IRDDLVTGVQTCALPILIAALDPWIAFGCANSSPESSLAQKQGTEYQLTHFIGSSREIKLPAKPALTLTLVSPERVAGFAGVNRSEERRVGKGRGSARAT